VGGLLLLAPMGSVRFRTLAESSGVGKRHSAGVPAVVDGHGRAAAGQRPDVGRRQLRP
jgi:hypothetical protein